MHKKILPGLITALIVLCAQPAFGWMMYSADAPDTGLLDNSFVDMLYNDNIVWLASGNGLSYSTNLGFSWLTLTTETNPGLGSNQSSALFGRPGEVWVAGSHSEAFEGINYPFGDGISRSTDGGQTWELFSPPEATNFANLIYDITGHDSSVYAACFHGGFIVKHGSDTVWKHLFLAPLDSADWIVDGWADLSTGRYYSCAADTTHADTMIIYGGSARGVNKFFYLPKRVKLGGNMIFDMEQAGEFIYMAHEGGVTQADTALNTYYTTDRTGGLGADWIRGLKLYGGRLWAAGFDPADTSGRGLYYLNHDPDSEWTFMAENLVSPSDVWLRADAGEFAGPSGGALDFAAYENASSSAMYVAAGDSGLYRTLDTGMTWERLFIDPGDVNVSSPRNQVYSVDVTADSLFLGTKAGLVVAAYTQPFTVTFDTIFTFPEDDSTGSFVSFVRHQDSDTASFTYVGVRPQTPAGNSALLFIDPDLDSLGNVEAVRTTHMLYSTEAGVDVITNDAYLTEPISVIASTIGLYASMNFPAPGSISPYSVADVTTGRTLSSFEFLSADFLGGKIFCGSTGGFAYQAENNEWRIFTANTDPLSHDLAVALRHDNVDLPGDWVVALAVQPYDTSAVIWAACRRVPDTSIQINAVAFSTDFGATWQEALPNLQAWNFAFDKNGVAYVAASEGLYTAPHPWDTWTRQILIDPVTQDTIASSTEIFAVEVADTIVFVGTELGLAIKHIDPDSSWNITRIFTETESADEVFAAPVPYSPVNNNGRLSLHYHVEEDAEITMEIYDFAMNLVRVVTENRFRTGGSDYYETWDGYNGRGEMVATGIYFIKVMYSTGQERWGRLAIIP